MPPDAARCHSRSASASAGRVRSAVRARRAMAGRSPRARRDRGPAVAAGAVALAPGCARALACAARPAVCRRGAAGAGAGGWRRGGPRGGLDAIVTWEVLCGVVRGASLLAGKRCAQHCIPARGQAHSACSGGCARASVRAALPAPRRAQPAPALHRAQPAPALAPWFKRCSATAAGLRPAALTASCSCSAVIPKWSSHCCRRAGSSGSTGPSGWVAGVGMVDGWQGHGCGGQADCRDRQGLFPQRSGGGNSSYTSSPHRPTPGVQTPA